MPGSGDGKQLHLIRNVRLKNSDGFKMSHMGNGNVMHHTAMDYKKRVCQAMNFISKNLDRDLSGRDCWGGFFLHVSLSQDFQGRGRWNRRRVHSKAASWAGSKPPSIQSPRRYHHNRNGLRILKLSKFCQGVPSAFQNDALSLSKKQDWKQK